MTRTRWKRILEPIVKPINAQDEDIADREALFIVDTGEQLYYNDLGEIE